MNANSQSRSVTPPPSDHTFDRSGHAVGIDHGERRSNRARSTFDASAMAPPPHHRVSPSRQAIAGTPHEHSVYTPSLHAFTDPSSRYTSSGSSYRNPGVPFADPSLQPQDGPRFPYPPYAAAMVQAPPGHPFAGLHESILPHLQPPPMQPQSGSERTHIHAYRTSEEYDVKHPSRHVSPNAPSTTLGGRAPDSHSSAAHRHEPYPRRRSSASNTTKDRAHPYIAYLPRELPEHVLHQPQFLEADAQNHRPPAIPQHEQSRLPDATQNYNSFPPLPFSRSIDLCQTAFLFIDFQNVIIDRLRPRPDVYESVEHAIVVLQELRLYNERMRRLRQAAKAQEDLDTLYPIARIIHIVIDPQRIRHPECFVPDGMNKLFGHLIKLPPFSDKSMQIIDEMTPREDEKVVNKPRGSPFQDTDLLAHLQEHKIKTVFMSGSAITGAINTAVMTAADRNLHVNLLHETCCEPIDTFLSDILMQHIIPKKADFVSVHDLLRVLRQHA